MADTIATSPRPRYLEPYDVARELVAAGHVEDFYHALGLAEAGLVTEHSLAAEFADFNTFFHQRNTHTSPCTLK